MFFLLWPFSFSWNMNFSEFNRVYLNFSEFFKIHLNFTEFLFFICWLFWILRFNMGMIWFEFLYIPFWLVSGHIGDLQLHCARAEAHPFANVYIYSQLISTANLLSGVVGSLYYIIISIVYFFYILRQIDLRFQNGIWSCRWFSFLLEWNWIQFVSKLKGNVSTDRPFDFPFVFGTKLG